MNELSNSFKRYLLVNYTKAKLAKYKKELFNTLPWIQSKSLYNTISIHINTLLQTLFTGQYEQSLSENKFIVDSILKYTLERSENLIKANRKTKDIKFYMQLNSYIVYDEITKGFETKRSKQLIKYNIEKQLSKIQEKIDSKINMEEILDSVIVKN